MFSRKTVLLFAALLFLPAFSHAYEDDWTNYALKDQTRLSLSFLDAEQVGDRLHAKFEILNNLDSKQVWINFGYSDKLDLDTKNLSFMSHECTQGIKRNLNATWCRIPITVQQREQFDLWFKINKYGSERLSIWVEVPTEEAYSYHQFLLTLSEEQGKIAYSSISFFALLLIALGIVLWLAVFFAATSHKADEQKNHAVFFLQQFSAPLGILANLIFGFGFMLFVSPIPNFQSFALLAVAFAAGYFLLAEQVKAKKAETEERQMTAEELLQKRAEVEERVKRVKAEFMTGRVSGETYKQLTGDAEKELIDLDIKIRAKRQSASAVAAPLLPEESFQHSSLPIPSATAILVEGPTESAKIAFCFHYLKPLISAGKKVAVFSLKDSDFLADQLKTAAPADKKQNASFLKLDTDPTSIGIDVFSHAKTVGFDAASFDVLSGMLVKESLDRVLKFLEFNLGRLKKDGKTVLFLADNESASKQSIAAVEQLFDAIIEFKVVEAGSQTANCVKVKRFPGYSKEPKWLLYSSDDTSEPQVSAAPESQPASEPIKPVSSEPVPETKTKEAFRLPEETRPGIPASKPAEEKKFSGVPPWVNLLDNPEPQSSLPAEQPISPQQGTEKQEPPAQQSSLQPPAQQPSPLQQDQLPSQQPAKESSVDFHRGFFSSKKEQGVDLHKGSGQGQGWDQ